MDEFVICKREATTHKIFVYPEIIGSKSMAEFKADYYQHCQKVTHWCEQLPLSAPDEYMTSDNIFDHPEESIIPVLNGALFAH